MRSYHPTRQWSAHCAVGEAAVEPQALIVGEKEGFVPLFIDARDVERPAAGDSELIAMVVNLGRCRSGC
jgi:hypothetical protein